MSIALTNRVRELERQVAELRALVAAMQTRKTLSVPKNDK